MPLPNHLAIIPDGNRRWAKAHLLLPWQGHAEGVKRFWEIAELVGQAGIDNLTIWGSSYDNLAKRPKREVNVLFELMKKELSNPDLLADFEKHQISLKIVGEWEKFTEDSSLPELVASFEQATEHNSKNRLTILFGYDGQREMVAAVNQLVLGGEEVTAENLRKALWTAGLPDVDYVIRTGGEPHWSAGFMMWHTANSQFYFTEQLWPDFKAEQLKTALDEFERRERRLGK